jgi:hypothetical protein
MQNYIHSGSTGDIVFSLPIIKDMGGGNLYITNFHKQRSQSIKKLIEVQPYINEVIITDEPVEGVNLNLFRNYAGHFNNLIKSYYQAHNMATNEWWLDGWLTLPERKPIFPGLKFAVINRTTNYADPYFDWKKEVEYLKTITDEIFFLGYLKEWQLFQNTFGVEVNYTNIDFLDAAYLIQEAEIVSCCYSSMATIAQGLGVKYRLEQAPGHTCSTLFIDRETIINK